MRWGVEICANGCRVQIPLRDADETTARCVANAWMRTPWCTRWADSVTAKRVSERRWKDGSFKCEYDDGRFIARIHTDRGRGLIIGPEMTLEDVVYSACWIHKFIGTFFNRMIVIISFAPKPPEWWPKDLAAKIIRGEANPDARLNWMWTTLDHPLKSEDLYVSHLEVALMFQPNVEYWIFYSRCSPFITNFGNPKIVESVCGKFEWSFGYGGPFGMRIPSGAKHIISTDGGKLWRPLLGGSRAVEDAVRIEGWKVFKAPTDMPTTEPATPLELILSEACYGSKWTPDIALSHPDGDNPLPTTRAEIDAMLTHTTQAERERVAQLLRIE